MANDTTTTVGLLTPAGSKTFNATADAGGNLSLQSTPRANGAPVSPSNRLPVQTRDPVAPVASTVLSAGLVLKAGPCNVYAVHAAPTDTGWVMLVDATTVPADGQITPLKAWAYQQSQPRAIDVRFDPPLAMTNGAVLLFSSSGPYTKTAYAMALLSGEVA